MAKLRVRRKAYKRKPYVRKGGTHVKATRVPASTFTVRDRGKPGRTPKEEQFYHPKVHMGWKKTQGTTVRRRLALSAHKGDELATARALMSLSNVSTDTMTKRLSRQDALYFYAKHRGK